MPTLSYQQVLLHWIRAECRYYIWEDNKRGFNEKSPQSSSAHFENDIMPWFSFSYYCLRTSLHHFGVLPSYFPMQFTILVVVRCMALTCGGNRTKYPDSHCWKYVLTVFFIFILFASFKIELKLTLKWPFSQYDMKLCVYGIWWFIGDKWAQIWVCIPAQKMYSWSVSHEVCLTAEMLFSPVFTLLE